jgi:hypothetical protein
MEVSKIIDKDTMNACVMQSGKVFFFFLLEWFWHIAWLSESWVIYILIGMKIVSNDVV